MNYRDILCLLLGIAPTVTDQEMIVAARAFALRYPLPASAPTFQGMSAAVGRGFPEPIDSALTRESVRQQLGISKEEWDRKD